MSAKFNDKLFIALILVIAASSVALGSNTFFRVIRGSGAGAGVDLKSFEKRFSPIRDFLGEDESAGYYSDLKEGPPKTSRFLYARIILAPRTLNYQPAGNAVIADLSGGGAIGGRPGLESYSVEKDFGGGLYLLRKSGE